MKKNVLTLIVILCMTGVCFSQAPLTNQLNQTLNLHGNFFVPSGPPVVIFNSKLSFDSNAEIRIDAGGQLFILNGSILTSADSTHRWKGIRIIGNPIADQLAGSLLSTSQGWLMMRESKISTAQVGVSVGTMDSLGNMSQGGGIFRANNCSFTDCWNAVTFCPYGFKQYNMSYFRKCNFEWKSRMGINPVTMQFATQVLLFETQGVFFMGCNFKNTTNSDSIDNFFNDNIMWENSIDDAIKGIGLYAVNSSYTLKPAGTCYNEIIADSSCTRCGGDSNLFEGLHTGIIHHSLNPYINIRGAITGSVFRNNLYGIRNYTSKNLFVNRCNFYSDVNIQHIQSQSYSNYTETNTDSVNISYVYNNNCMNYDISQNNFICDMVTNNSGFIMGPVNQVVNIESGTNYGRVYKNNHLNRHFAVGATCYNRLSVFDRFEGDNRGLSILCNTYDQFYSDTAECEKSSDWLLYTKNTLLSDQTNNTSSNANTWSNLLYCASPGFEPANIWVADSMQDTITIWSSNPSENPSCIKFELNNKFKTSPTSPNLQLCNNSSYCHQFGYSSSILSNTAIIGPADSLSDGITANNYESLDDDFESGYVEVPIGIKQTEERQVNLPAYPVPVENELNIVLENNIKATRIELIDIGGKTYIENYSQKGNTINIATENIHSGFWVARIYAAKNNYIVKFVKL